MQSGTPRTLSTSVMTGAQESLFHCEVQLSFLEHFPEHQPQFMKCGAVKHTEHVRKWAHPGPAEGILNILIREKGMKGES